MVVADLVTAAAAIAAKFYHYPALTLKLIGVTGTNGKTTTTHLIEYFLSQAEIPTALFGTLYTRWQGFQETANHTTPFANELQASLAKAVSAGNEIAVMEVSSHALAQGRVQGCTFPVTVRMALLSKPSTTVILLMESWGKSSLVIVPVTGVDVPIV